LIADVRLVYDVVAAIATDATRRLEPRKRARVNRMRCRVECVLRDKVELHCGGRPQVDTTANGSRCRELNAEWACGLLAREPRNRDLHWR
jgi:hypothetical protein